MAHDCSRSRPQGLPLLGCHIPLLTRCFLQHSRRTICPHGGRVYEKSCRRKSRTASNDCRSSASYLINATIHHIIVSNYPKHAFHRGLHYWSVHSDPGLWPLASGVRGRGLLARHLDLPHACSNATHESHRERRYRSQCTRVTLWYKQRVA